MNPLITLIIGLLLASIIGSFISAFILTNLQGSSVGAIWGVTLLVTAIAGYLAYRTDWLYGLQKLTLPVYVSVTAAIFTALGLLTEAIDLLADPYGLVVALVIAGAVGYGVYQRPGPQQARTILAVLLAALLFLSLYF